MNSSLQAETRSWGGYLLGFSLGGFFNAILLHRILQWPHLLLALPSGQFRDFRTQVLLDGLFHLSLHLIALAGLWLLYRAWATGRLPAPRMLLGDALLGFGAWHVLDAILSHWLLGIHRVGMDAANPLFRELLWLLLFGLLPILAGAFVQRRGAGEAHHPVSSGAGVAASALALGVLVAAPVAALSPKASDAVAVVLPAGHADSLIDGVQPPGLGVLRTRHGDLVWMLRLQPDTDPDVYHHHGALLATDAPTRLRCLAWTRMPAEI